jgi:hypothetical protein
LIIKGLNPVIASWALLMIDRKKSCLGRSLSATSLNPKPGDT